jgi:hypothetical protein
LAEGKLIDVQLNGVSIMSENRKLRVTWTMEAAEYLRTVHNIDVRDEVLRHHLVNPTVQFTEFDVFTLWGQASNLSHVPEQLVSWQEEGF